MAFDRRAHAEINNNKESINYLSRMANMLSELNATELLGPAMLKENFESSYGLHFDYIEGNAYHVYGTTTRTSFYNLYSNKTQLPLGMTAGETYKLTYSGKIVWFYVFVYTSDDPETAVELFRSNNSMEFTIPSNAVGMMLRISVLGEGRVVDETVIPEIYNGWYEISQKSKSLYQTNSRVLLSPIMSVTDYDAHNVTMTYIGNGQFHIQSAGSERTAFKSLFKSVNSMPDGMSAGETYFVSFTGVNVRFYVLYTTDGTNWVTLVSTTESRKFTIPEEAIGLDIRITVLDAGTVVDEVVSPEIYTAYSDQILSRHLLATDDSIEYKRPLLTIIDDDGNLGFYTDLLPLIESKNISISMAVVGYRIAEAEAGTRPTYMTWDKIIDAYNRGAEVLSHSYSHWGEDAVDSRTVGEVAKDYTMMRHLLSSHGIDTGDILVYPGASGSSAIARAASERASICAIRSSGNVTNFYGATPRYDIKRYRLEAEYSYDLTQIKQLLDELAKTGGWMIWMIHTSQNWNADSLATITSAIEYALAKNIPIVSAHYGAKKYLGVN